MPHAPVLPVRTHLARPLHALLRSPLIESFAAPHGIDRYLELVDPAWSVRDVRGTVEQIIRETSTTTTVVLRPNANWRGHLAGQHVRVGVEIAGTRQTRCYSVSSSAYDTDRITITVKAKHEGYVSHAVQDLRVGQVLALSTAQGGFVLPEQRPARIVLISGGSGITPVMSMLRTLLDEGYAGEITFLHYARSAEEQIYASELAAISGKNVRVLRGYDDGTGELGGGFRGEHLDALDLASAETFLCGPEPMMAAVRISFAKLGIAGKKLHEEQFTGAPLLARSNSEGATINFLRSNVRKVSSGKTLLETAEASGLNPEHGCRRGICHGCTKRKVAGTVRDLRTGAISDAPDQDIQICVSEACGDVTLDL